MICDRAEQIDIRWLPKEARPLPDVIHFDGERITTTWTAMQFGGRRQWFLCPSCDRRCAVIYKIAGGPLWGCRLCMVGRYASEHKSPQGRRIQKALKIRKRLGQTEGNLHLPFPEKPRHMHYRTYELIRDEANALEHEIGLHDLARIRRQNVEDVRAMFAERKLKLTKD